MCFPVEDVSEVPQLVKNPPAMQKTWTWSLGWGDPLEEGMATHSGILPWRIPMDRGSWWATVHGVAKSPTWLSTEASPTFIEHMLCSGPCAGPCCVLGPLYRVVEMSKIHLFPEGLCKLIRIRQINKNWHIPWATYPVAGCHNFRKP